MKLPSQKRILREDLKDAPNWVSGIIDPVNSFMESVYQALNKNTTFQDNIAGQIKEITLRTSSLYPVMDQIRFQSELKTKAIGLSVQQVYDKALYTPPSGAVTVNWVEENGTIIIFNITGLDVSKTYLVRLLVI